jgi:hypothetical protein
MIPRLTDETPVSFARQRHRTRDLGRPHDGALGESRLEESWQCLWFCYSRSVTSPSRICWSASRGKAQVQVA